MFQGLKFYNKIELVIPATAFFVRSKNIKISNRNEEQKKYNPIQGKAKS